MLAGYGGQVNTPNRKLPIGIQDFEDLRQGGYLYVDKTEYIYRLVNSGKPYFLSRPRRFGKSLFLSTLRAYFEGKKELFYGLEITELEKDAPDAWQKHPVFYVDFNRDEYKSEHTIEKVLEAHLSKWESTYEVDKGEYTLAGRFQNLIEAACEKTGKKAVILVDEYDKPLLEAADPERAEHNKAVFKGFFSTLKSYDRYIKFVFITGVTKFSKVSIFSDLNQLNDISLDKEYSGICGVTEEELKATFAPEMDALAEGEELNSDECLAKLKRMYDGYHFSSESEGVYNPFSLLNAFSKKSFGMYWFSTGTPTFLIEKIKQSSFDPKRITEGELYENENVLQD